MDAIGLNCVIRRAREGKALSSQLVVGAWKAQYMGSTRLEGSLVIRVL